jgi:hypothetical protein
VWPTLWVVLILGSLAGIEVWRWRKTFHPEPDERAGVTPIRTVGEIQAAIQARTGVRPRQVNCDSPFDLSRRLRRLKASYTCTIITDLGRARVHVITSGGGWSLLDPIIGVAQVEASIALESAREGRTVRVDCGAARLRTGSVGSHFDCTVEGDAPGTVRVVLRDVLGRFAWSRVEPPPPSSSPRPR